MLTDTNIKSAPAIACDLTAIEAGHREQHLLTAKQLIEMVEEINELPDGFALRLPGDSETFLHAARFISRERECCSFFHFTLDLAPSGGPLWLNLTGPEGVKQLLQAELGIINLSSRNRQDLRQD